MNEKIWKIKSSIEKFFYKTKVNIFLLRVLESPERMAFKSLMKSAIKQQLQVFTKKEVINRIIGLEKGMIDNPELLDGIMHNWLFLASIIDESEISSYLIFAANHGGQSAFDKLGIDKKFSLTNGGYIKSLSQRSKQSMTMIEKTTQLWVVKTIRESLKQNLSSEEIARLIKSYVVKISKERADLISEHETALTMGEMEAEVYRRSGISLMKWITANDELTCSICMGNGNAGEIPVGALFPSGVLTTPAHQRCRCFMLPIIPTSINNIWDGQ